MGFSRISFLLGCLSFSVQVNAESVSDSSISISQALDRMRSVWIKSETFWNPESFINFVVEVDSGKKGEPLSVENPRVRIMRRYFEIVISLGIDRLRQFNPALVNSKLLPALQSRLILSDGVGSGIGWAEHSSWSHTIFAGGARVAISQPEKLNLKANLLNWGPLFHEFLHHARTDNQSTDKHNTLIAEGMNHSEDSVYSCARLAFPFAFENLGQARVFLAKEECFTCVKTSSSLWGGTYIDESKQPIAEELCKEISDSDFIWKPTSTSQNQLPTAGQLKVIEWIQERTNMMELFQKD